MIPVTKPFLPPIEEYQQYLSDIWERNWLTNHGPLVNDLELKLKEYLNIDHLLYVSNGTIALQIAIKALNLSGEIITTPFSYVATSSAITWEGCRPVFVDIEKDSLNINPELITSAITTETSAILATHVFGNPCAIEKIEKIAKANNLSVIYDAAHCFGIRYKGKSIFRYGDISTTSFHATKLFHTAEGGALIAKKPDLLKKAFFLHNFGHDGPEKFEGVGINGKNSELHAAMGLCNLKYLSQVMNKRKFDFQYYKERLNGTPIIYQKIREGTEYNFSYFPAIFETENQMLKVKSELEANRIFPKRYFYPVLSKLNYVQKFDVPIAESVADRILCLPSYYSLSKQEIDMVCRCIIRSLKYN